jgi:hypothetical protein
VPERACWFESSPGHVTSLVSVNLQGFLLLEPVSFIRFSSLSATFFDTQTTHGMTHRFFTCRTISASDSIRHTTGTLPQKIFTFYLFVGNTRFLLLLHCNVYNKQLLVFRSLFFALKAHSLHLYFSTKNCEL